MGSLKYVRVSRQKGFDVVDGRGRLTGAPNRVHPKGCLVYLPRVTE
jgi:hypothetical protein